MPRKTTTNTLLGDALSDPLLNRAHPYERLVYLALLGMTRFPYVDEVPNLTAKLVTYTGIEHGLVEISLRALRERGLFLIDEAPYSNGYFLPRAPLYHGAPNVNNGMHRRRIQKRLHELPDALVRLFTATYPQWLAPTPSVDENANRLAKYRDDQPSP